MNQETDNRAEDQARAQVASIVAMVAALQCDYERLEGLREEFEGLEGDEKHAAELGKSEWPSDVTTHVGNDLIYFYDLGRELAELSDAAGECTDADDARQRIEEDALSVEVRSGWSSPGNQEEMTPEEFRILLCTGGPHVEIVGDLDRGQPSRVRILYRDWGTSGELFDFDHDAVLTYCACFYFGE